MIAFCPAGGLVVFCVGFNGFYAFVEMGFPPLFGLEAVGVAGIVHERVFVIVACISAAIRFGVPASLPLCVAAQQCSDLIVFAVTFDGFVAASLAMFAIVGVFSDLVSCVSIAGVYVDIPSCHVLGGRIFVAILIGNGFYDRFAFLCVIGIAPVVFLADAASVVNHLMGVVLL
ncbi:Y-family DNA polymerase [Bacillus sp. MB2021]|uniref:Y-family DNA polymerase n=1 Tax=Bacillus sp. MB2021 TaxID=1408303 RepID=UPI001E62B1A1|nr:hypothetical protein [Bacillus sp. MB2021]